MLKLMTEQTPPPAERLRHFLLRRDLAAVRHRSDVSRRLGVSDDEMLVLLNLLEHGGLTQSQLTSFIGLSRSGMGAMIQRLERAQLVERHPDPADRRVRLIKPSPRSVDRITRAYEALWEDVDRVLAELPSDAHEVIARFLTDLATVTETHARCSAGEPELSRERSSQPDWQLWG